MSRLSSTLGAAAAALALAACTGDTATAPPAPSAGAPGALRATTAFEGGAWTVGPVLPYPYPGGGVAVAINDAGQVVGSAYGRGAFRVTLGRADTLFYTPSFEARAINNRGEVVGLERTGPSTTRAVVRRADGARVELLANGSAVAAANDVNDRGQVVGSAGGQAVLWEPDGTVVRIGALLGTTAGSAAVAVNATGVVAGNVLEGTRWRAFLWSAADGVRWLSVPEGGGRVDDVNDAGVVVGRVSSNFDYYPAVWETPAGYALLPTGGGSSGFSEGMRINNRNVVIGSVLAQYGYLWTRLDAPPLRLRSVGCDGALVCSYAIASPALGINDAGQIAGSITQEGPGLFYGENPVVWQYLTEPPSLTETGPLVSAQSGKCVDVPNGSTAPGVSVILYSCHGGENQRFTLPRVGSTGEIRVLGLCLTLRGNPDYTDAVYTATCGAGYDQWWMRRTDGTLYHPASGRCLDVFGEQSADLTPVWLWRCSGGANQRWSVGGTTAPPPAPPAAATGALVSAQSGKCVDVPNGTTVPGASVILYACHGGTNQQFTAPAAGASGPLRVLGLCLALRGDPDYTDAVVTAACDAASAAQQWTRRGDGTLYHAASGRCLDVFGEQTADLTPIWLWHCGGGANQRWAVVAPPTVLATTR